MNNPRFCDLHACGEKVAREIETGTPKDVDIANYRLAYLSPYTVGYRKGIFVPRELVDKLSKTVSLFGNPDLTIGAYVTNILIDHLASNRDVINELTERGSKTVLV